MRRQDILKVLDENRSEISSRFGVASKEDLPVLKELLRK